MTLAVFDMPSCIAVAGGGIPQAYRPAARPSRLTLTMIFVSKLRLTASVAHLTVAKADSTQRYLGQCRSGQTRAVV